MNQPPIPGRVVTVVLNWNGSADTIDCVRSLRELRDVDNTILVVDNGSTDDSLARLRGAFPDLWILETGANLGYAGGNNAGIEAALARGADFVWLLNNDTTVDPETLAALVAALAERPDAGLAGSKIYYAARPETLWCAGCRYTTRYGFAEPRGQGERDEGQYDVPDEIEFATGCSVLARREVIAAIGPLSEDYFMSWEDVDWSAAAAAAGWRILYVPGSRVWHKVGASMGSVPGRADLVQLRYEIRNRILFHRRRHPARTPRVIFHAFNHAVRNLLARPTRQTGVTMLRGIADAICNRRGRIDG
jgi:hypothetical protein